MLPKSLAGELLATFSRKERRAFERFLARPEHRVSPAIIEFAGQLMRQRYPTDLTALHQSLYPGSSFSRQRLNQLLSDLNRLGQQFLVERQAPELAGAWLAQEFHRRGLGRHRDRHIRRLDKELIFYADRFALERQRHKVSTPADRKNSYNLQRMDQLLELDFMVKKLRQACLMIAHETVAPVGYDFGLLDAVLSAITDDLLAEHPLIAGYFYSYRFITDPEAEEDFNRVHAILRQPTAQFTHDDTQTLYYLCINFNIRRLNQGELQRVDSTLQLYQEGIREGYLLDNGHLSATTFRNAIAIGIRGGHLDWAEQFIRDYRSHLPDDQRDSLVHLSRARLAYERGDTEGALLEMRHVNPSDTLSNLTVIVMKSKIYYELGEIDLLTSSLESARVLVWRKERTYHRQAYRNFIAVLLRILHLKPGDVTGRQKVDRAVEETAVLPERSWLRSLLQQ